MEPSPLAYAVAHRMIVLFSDEQFGQRTCGMEPIEFTDCLAGEVQVVLNACPNVRSYMLPPQTVFEAGEGAPVISTITDTKARQLIEALPPEVKAVYGKAVRNNAAPREALEKAFEALRVHQEKYRECQLPQPGSDDGIAQPHPEEHGGIHREHHPADGYRPHAARNRRPLPNRQGIGV